MNNAISNIIKATIEDMTVENKTLDNLRVWKTLRNIEVPALFDGSTAADMNVVLITEAVRDVAFETIVKASKPNGEFTLSDVRAALATMFKESVQVVAENLEESVEMFGAGDGFALEIIARVSVLDTLIEIVDEQMD